MPVDIRSMRQERSALADEIDAMLGKAVEEKRSITEAEDADVKQKEGRIEELGQMIERAEKNAKIVDEGKTVIAPHRAPAIVGKAENDDEFRNVGEFLNAIIRAHRGSMDKRLVYHEDRASQQMGTGELGGFMLPEKFLTTLLSVPPDQAVVRPRANVIQAGDYPDVPVYIPALDQTSAQNMYGGITVYHSDELQSLTETNIRIRRVKLEPKKLTGLMYTSNEMLRNSGAFSGLIESQMRAAVIGAEDYDFLRGSGVNAPVGIINAPAKITYSRATASQIAYADVLGMYARFLQRGGSAVWVASPTTIPQLGVMVDSGSHNIWMGALQNSGGIAGPVPTTLFGIPLIFNERMATLGSLGDLMLCNMSFYVIKNGSGPFVDMSEHVRFASDETAFRIVWRVDGQPWLSEPITQEGTTSSTLSPFVVLQ